MFILFATISLLFIHNVESIMMAKARIHSDSSNNVTGYLMFTQINNNSSVIIRGKFWNMAPNTVHVS